MIQLSGRFVPVKVNAEKEGVAVAKKYGVKGYPTILFVDSKEKVVYQIVGYQPPADFAKSLERASTIRQDLAKYSATLKKDPNDFRALAGLAGLNAATGDLAAAKDYMARAEQHAKASDRAALLDAYNAVGDGLQNGNDPAGAITYFEKAIDSAFPTQSAYARISIAACCFASGQPKKAIPYLEAFLKMGPEADAYRDQAKQMLAAAQKG